jgi:ribosomal protein L40E
MRHVYALAELYTRVGDLDAARDEYLASLDADEGLSVLLIPDDEIVAAVGARRPSRRTCDRCGARLSPKRHRCSRCGLARQ